MVVKIEFADCQTRGHKVTEELVTPFGCSVDGRATPTTAGLSVVGRQLLADSNKATVVVDKAS